MAKRKLTINLNEIDNFAFALQKKKHEVMARVQKVADAWAAATKTKYDSISGHVVIHNKKSFYTTAKDKDGNGLRVAVGHESYIARFLEVGTKPHEIAHRQGRGYAVARVRGIKGNKALSKAFTGNRNNLEEMLRQEITKLLEEK